MGTRTIGLDDALQGYLHRASLREPEPLQRLREETARLPHARMQISPEQGQLMGLLVELVGARRALEVGVFTGYSSLCVALALPADGELVACDVSAEWTAMAERYWQLCGVSHKVRLHLAPASETLARLVANGEAGTYDFAFIDADKPRYGEYYERCLELLRPGGLVAVDNALWSGRVADDAVQDGGTRAIRALNERVHGDERVTASLVPIGDGMLLARKR